MKKILKRLIIVTVLFNLLINTSVYATILHEIREEQVITKGAVHINEKLLFSGGWRNVNILKIYPNEENISIKPMESSTGVERQTILDMVNNSGAVAGVNADYFDMGTSNTPSLGTFIKDGKLGHAYNSNYSTLGPNKNMATFLIDTNNNPLMSYYGVSIKLSANGEFIGAAATKNNIPGTITRPIIVDNQYRQNTNSIVSVHKTIYTIVVENNKVTYRSTEGKGVTIPDNGYAVLIPQSMANEYYSKMPIGAEIRLDESMYLGQDVTHSMEQLKLGVGGSGLIMKDGKPYTGAAHKVTPNSAVARTVVATTKNNAEILLITVDNQGNYIGATHELMLELLQRYNVKDAMYLDGGGSTTLVARNEGSFTPTLQNKPTGVSQRKVINGLGIFSNLKSDVPAKLYIEPNTQRTFIGEKVNFEVKAVDDNSNPVKIDSSNIKFTVSGGTGNFTGTTFSPTSSGNMLIVASYNGIEAGTEIIVNEEVKGLVIEPSNLQLNPNTSKQIQVYAMDKDGYKIPINTSNVKWSSSSSYVTVNGNTVSATQNTIAKLTATYKNRTKQIGVVVGNTSVPIESFESNAAKWNGDTSSVTGTVQLSKDLKYHGNQSIKMAYTFMPSTNKQVAYTVFDKPVLIPADASSINMWLNARNQGHVAKIEVVDGTGKTYYLKLSDSLNFTGWKYVSTQLPETMALPAKVTKLYVYSNSNSEKISTALYMDHMSITRGVREKIGVTLRDDRTADPYYREDMQVAIDNQYEINAVGTTKVNSMLVSNSTLNSISGQLSGAPVILTSTNNNPLSLTSPTYTYKNTYESVQYNNTTVVMLPTGNGGLRTTQAESWTYLKNTLNGTSSDHIIIVMSRAPLSQFNDALEGKALHDYLSQYKAKTGKNVFVLTPGGIDNEVVIEDGIRYIKTHGLNVLTDDYKQGSYVKFKVIGKSIYYTFEKFR